MTSNVNLLDTPVPHINGGNLLKPTKYTSEVKWSKNTGEVSEGRKTNDRAKRAENLKKKIIRIFD